MKPTLPLFTFLLLTPLAVLTAADAPKPAAPVVKKVDRPQPPTRGCSA